MNHSTKHDSDPLDGLLHSYFRAEMPQPWPALPRTQLTARRPSTWGHLSSRLALAAAVALLLGTGYFLSGSLNTLTGPQFGPLGPGKATKEKLPELPGFPMNN